MIDQVGAEAAVRFLGESRRGQAAMSATGTQTFPRGIHTALSAETLGYFLLEGLARARLRQGRGHL